MDVSPELLEFISRKKAASDFLLFIKYTKPDFEINWHHRVLAEKLEAFSEGKIKKLMIYLPPQVGKLLPADTPILTANGFKSHGLLQPGDYVFGQDGLPKRVLANSGIYKWNVDKINFQCGRSILAAKEHVWKLQVEYDDHKGRREWIGETQHIFNKRHRRSPAINIAPALQTAEKVLPIDPYILGCWLGDGSRNLGSLTVGKEDIEHFKQYGKHQEVKPGVYSLLINGLRVKLRQNGLIKNKHIPIDYLLSSVDQRMELLRGLMDTDGCCDNRGCCEFTQMGGRLADDVYLLLRSLGFKANVHYYKAMLDDRHVGTKARIFFFPNKTDIIFKLERKQHRLSNKTTNDRQDKYRLFIESIEPYGEVDGNCIEVEGGMYLAGYDLIPTHNSEMSTRRLPPFILGKDPDKRIAICAYNQTFSSQFNRDIQRIMSDIPYRNIFPNTSLNEKNVVNNSHGSYVRNSEVFEIVGYKGRLKTVGVGGPLTGTSVDVGIIDDPIKDAKEAYSSTFRENLWNWYDTVFCTRLHNHSQQLITLTRWHEDDLAGRIMKREKDWDIVILPAIKEDHSSDLDPREIGEAIWPERHSLERMLAIKKNNSLVFSSLYQQRPYFNAEEGRFAFAFNRAQHVGSTVYNPAQYIYLSFDFNRNPICCTVIQHYDNCIYVLRCIKLKDSNIYALCREIKRYYPNAVFIITGDATGQNSSALVEGNINYYIVIKEQLGLSDMQIKVPTVNPKIQANQVLVNNLLLNYKWVIDEANAAGVIYDLEYVKMLPDGTIDKSSRTDPTKQADALDTIRYWCQVFMDWFLKMPDTYNPPAEDTPLNNSITSPIDCTMEQYPVVRTQLLTDANNYLNEGDTVKAQQALAEVKRLDAQFSK